MAAIQGRDTKPELVIRKGLHARGFRFRLQGRDLPGRPDLVFPKYRALLWVHGCFWHGHDCSLFILPATRREFWQNKIERNRNRDDEVRHLLAESRWRQLTIWECAFRGPGRIGLEATIENAVGWLRSDMRYGEIRSGHERVLA